MYELIENLIDHAYQSNYGGDQQYIYNCAITLICLFSVVLIDMFYRFMHNIFKGGS